LTAVLIKKFEDFLELTNLDKPVIVINNFLKNPDEIRELAMQEEYKEDKVYPGKRSPRQSIEGPLVNTLERFVGKPILKMESIFQIQPTEYETHSFVHGDLCDWAAVLYLNKDCDGRPGTCFYRHKETGMEKLTLGVELMFTAIEKGIQPNDVIAPAARDRFDLEKWDVTLTVPIQYNRLVLYNAKLYHRNASAWGTNIRDARLVQSFFIFTEPFGGRETAGVDVLEREGAARSV
jgi:hypothetical protein